MMIGHPEITVYDFFWAGRSGSSNAGNVIVKGLPLQKQMQNNVHR
jgi:hypothetical protein